MILRKARLKSSIAPQEFRRLQYALAKFIAASIHARILISVDIFA
jgi:hypothetical protein